MGLLSHQVLADIPASGTSSVLGGNIAGNLTGYFNGTGSYSSPAEGLGAGGNPVIFNLPPTWHYGGAIATISPLMHVKNAPVDTTVRHITSSQTIGIDGRPSFVGALSGNSMTGDTYTDTTIRANNVSWWTGTKRVTGEFSSTWRGSGYDTNKVWDPSDDAVVNNINDWDDPLDTNDKCDRQAWSNLATFGWEQYADMVVDIPFTFNFRPDTNNIIGQYIFDWGVYAEKLGCAKYWTPLFSGQVLTSYDSDSSSGNTYDKEGAWCFVSLELPERPIGTYRPDYNEGAGLLLYTYSFSSGNFYLNTWTGTSKTVSLSSLSHFITDAGETVLRFRFYNHVYSNYNWEQVFTYMTFFSAYLGMHYQGNNFPVPGMVSIDSAGSSPASSYEEWQFPGETAASKQWAVTIDPTSRGHFSTFSFDIYRITATKYFDAYYEGGLLSFEPSIRTGLVLNATPAIPFAIDVAGGGHVATATIPSVDAFSRYNKTTGALTFRVSIPTSTWDYLTYTLTMSYNLTIPFAIPYTGGAGSVTITVPKLTAFGLECTQAQVPNGTYVAQVLVNGNPREVYHAFTGFNATTPFYNSSWLLPYSQAMNADETYFTMTITTDTAPPDLLSWEMPALEPLGGYAIVEETEIMHFHLTYAETAPWQVFLAWTNESSSGELAIPIESGFVDIPATNFSYGNYHFWMFCRDKAGNVNATPSEWVIIVYESQPPVCEIINPEPGRSFAVAPTIVANIVDQNLNTSTVYLHTTRSSQTFQMISMYGGGSGFFVLDETHGNWAGWVTNFSGYAEGWINLWVSASDDRGNTGQSEPADFWALIDRHAPTLNLLGPQNNTAWNAPPPFSVVADDTMSNISIAYMVNGGGYLSDWVTVVDNQAPPVATTWTLSWSIFNLLPDGIFEVGLLVLDATGSNFKTGIYHLRKDTKAPFVTISDIASGQLFGAKPPTINFTVADDLALTCEIRVVLGGLTRVVIPVPESVGVPSGGNMTSFSYPVPASLWALVTWEGNAILDVLVNDSLHQTGSRSTTVQIDTIAPRVSIISPANGAIIDSLPPITVSGTDANYLIAWYSLDGGQTRYPITGLPGTTNFLCDQGAYDDAYAEFNEIIVAIEDTAGNVGFAKIIIERSDYLKYGPGPNPWIFFTIFEQAWPVQVMFWAPVAISAMYAIIVRRRKKTTAPSREVAL